MAELRRAQLLYGWIPVPRAYRDPQTSLRSAGLVKALRASFAALRPCRVTRPARYGSEGDYGRPARVRTASF